MSAVWTEKINWASDPDARTKQIRSIIMENLEPWVKDYLSKIESKHTAIVQIQNKLQNNVDAFSKEAYGSLESVVKALLLIESGEGRFKRQHPEIIGPLNNCTDKFSQLSVVCQDGVSELGKTAGDCRELSDSAAKFILELKTEMDQISGPVSSVFELKSQRDQIVEGKRQRYDDLVRQKHNIASSANDFGFQFSSIFSNDAENNLRERLKDAQQRIETNLDEQNREHERSLQFYKLAITSLNGSAAIASFMQKLKESYDMINFEYNHVTDHHQAADGLLRGLLDLRNQLFAGDWTSARDRSLQVVLQLMQKDDEVFKRKPYYEEIEANVKSLITASLGEGAVAKLLYPPTSEAPNGADQY